MDTRKSLDLAMSEGEKRKVGLGFVDVEAGNLEIVKKKQKMVYSTDTKTGVEKVLCVEIVGEDGTLSWFGIDPRRDDDGTSRSKMEITKMRAPNQYHDQMADYGTAVVGSRVFFIGGVPVSQMVPRPIQPVRDVSIYDTVQGTWCKGPSLNVCRCNPVAVIVVGTKIYVFGTLRRRYLCEDVPIDRWVECYDSTTGHWKTLPGPPNLNRDVTYTAVHLGDEIIFVGKDPGCYVFTISTERWTSLSQFDFPGLLIPHLEFFSGNHVVYGDFVFWHLFGNVYAWDWKTNKTHNLGKLEDRYGLWDPSNCNPDTSPPVFSYLRHLGNGFMCVLYWGLTDYRKPSLTCYTFQISGHPSSSTAEDGACPLTIASAAIRTFVIPNAEIMCGVFALSAKYAGLSPLGLGIKET